SLTLEQVQESCPVKRLDDSTMAIRTQGDFTLALEKHLPRRRVQRRQHTLDEEVDVYRFEAKIAMFAEERLCGVVVFLTRHDQQRHVPPIAASQSEDLLGVDLKEAPLCDGANRIRALGCIET